MCSCHIVPTLWQCWNLTLFFKIATTLWHCLNVVVWSDFNVGHRHSHNFAWMLSFGQNLILDTNVHMTFTQCCLNVGPTLWSNIVFNFVATLWQHCKIMIFSNIVTVLWQWYSNIVAMLLQCCDIMFVINIVATL